MSAIEAVPDLQVEGSPVVLQDDRERGKNLSNPEELPPVIPGGLVRGLSSVYRLAFSWSGKSFEVEMHGDDRIHDLRSEVQSRTAVPFERQKCVGLVKGKLPPDDAILSELGITALKRKFVVVGTPDDQTFKDPHLLNLADTPDVADNFDIAYDTTAPRVRPADDPRNIRLVAQKIEQYPINIMNPPRPRKKLLVLDLDYTLVDSKPLLAGALPPMECLRPFLHNFLEQAYLDFDIVVWSQTSIWWLESKLTECGIIGDEARNYKLLCVCDRKSMFPIFGERNGQVFKHEVKPLSFLWQQPAFQNQWNAKNTIHIDDLSRNFAMNPGEGLKIRAYHGASTQQEDDQLVKLSRYLKALAACDDFTTQDHGQWKKRNNPS